MNQIQSRRIIYIAIAFIPILYFILLFMLWNFDKNWSFTEYAFDLLVYSILGVLSIILSIRFVIKRWNVEVDNKSFGKDMIILAINSLPSILGVIYCLIQAYGDII